MLAHGSPETPGATVRIAGDRCEIWAATQSATLVRDEVASAIGFPTEAVVDYPTLVGGGFGRLLDPRPAVQAALIARQMKRPVQVVWSRFEDSAQDASSAPAMGAIRAALTPANTQPARKRLIAAAAN